MMQRDITLLKKAWTGIQSITAKITGTNTDAVYVETSDADATASDMLSGKTAYVNASKITGSIATKSSSDLTAVLDTVTVPAGYYASNATKTIEAVLLNEFKVNISKDTSTHVATCTPYILTDDGGYLDPDEYTGTASTVSASELVSGSETKTANGTYDVTNLAQLVVNVPTGGSGLTKLATKDLGTISTSSTTATDTGQTLEVSGINDYDFLLCIAHTSPHTNGRHVATTTIINLTATSNVSTKTAVSVSGNRSNYKLSSSGTMTQRSGASAYGIYVYSATAPSSGKTTLTIYQRYNSTNTGTINGAYVLDVYGMSIQDIL